MEASGVKICLEGREEGLHLEKAMRGTVADALWTIHTP